MNQKQQLNKKSEAAKRLLENEDFMEIIMGDYVKDGIIRHSIDGNLDSPSTVDELKARQIFHRYIFDIITYAENANK